ncbi:hypothetical protein BN1263320025 [Stenotrophomonas thermophila]|nr:hypothetical protein BN1263320025 [Stenotrophomonas maltophilia]
MDTVRNRLSRDWSRDNKTDQENWQHSRTQRNTTQCIDH